MEGLQPFFHRRVTKNVLLILLSIVCLPISAVVTLATVLRFNYHDQGRKFSQDENSSRKTILVTGVSMSKGLTIARLLGKHTDHRIIAADLERVPFTSPGRYCRFVNKFTRLDMPNIDNSDPYTKSLLRLIKNEAVDLWVSCSSVVGGVEDGKVMKLAEKTMGPGFRAIQFDDEVVMKFHEKDAFMDYLKDLGLVSPESHRCVSSQEVEDLISAYSVKGESHGGQARSFILKPIGVDDRARKQMMTLLPFPPDKKRDLKSYLSSLEISTSRPFLLQQYIQGPEYCTHSLVVNGEVKAFVACPSSDLLMHYEALPQSSILHAKMLQFTQDIAQREGDGFSGHLSFDFISEGEGVDTRLYPIECNPRAHTAVVLFNHSREMADQYLSCFGQKYSPGKVLHPGDTPGYYWIGHDLVTLVLVPFLAMFSREYNIEKLQTGLKAFWHHLMHWREGTFDSTDPWPFFVLYHLYWPSQFLIYLFNGREWSRINVSTTKVFES